MTFKPLTLTSPILLNHIKISFREYKPIQKYSRTLTFGIRKTPTRKVSANQTSPWWIPPLENSNQKIPTWNIPTHVFKYSHLFFFHYCRRYHWYYLKDYFIFLCFKSAEVFTFVKICQNKVLSEERELMKWMGILQERNFWVAIFRGGGGGGRISPERR